MPALPIVETFQVFKDLGLGFLPGLKPTQVDSSLFSVAKKLSATALSQQLPGRLVEHAMPRAASRC